METAVKEAKAPLIKQPLVEAMVKYYSDRVYPLHTPGHKGGRGMGQPLRDILGEQALAMDVSLMSELDDLHEPTGCLKEAQDLAAELYGSRACFFAVNGTTQAIHAMLMAALKPGDKVLIPRNAHRSVGWGLILADAVPVYVAPEAYEPFGLLGQIAPRQVQAAFEAQPDIKAVLVTSPNYYGMAADLKAIADIAHSYGAALLVDEAHGPHLGFSSLLPPSALSCGADMAAQSTHKILGAMTQCSMLQVGGSLISVQQVADTMSLLTTTSPNYLLMASLDSARAQMAEAGPELMEQAVKAALELRRSFEEFKLLRVLDKQAIGQAGIADLDLTKVTVNVKGWGISGIEAGEFLRKQGLAVELVDPENVLFLVAYADYGPEWEQTVARIRWAFEELQNKLQIRAKTPGSTEVEAKQQEGQRAFAALAAAYRQGSMGIQAKLPLRQVFYGAKETVPLSRAVGRICAESISFYPPGIPVLLPGEVITAEVAAYCQGMKALGLPVNGAADATLETIRVVESTR